MRIHMTIAEHQLETWANLPSSKQFTETFASIKSVLESTRAPYYGKRNFKVHLRGSYRNDTNVYGTGDVDIVACTSDTFGYDQNDLLQGQQDLYRNSNGPNVQSACIPFKQELFSWLGAYYGYGEVNPGKKAIVLKGNGTRRKSDILACTEYRHYYHYAFAGDPSFHPGIRFCTTDGQWIVNYPKQHYKNCAAKHQDTNEWFKPTARILKNMRNRMIDDRIIGADLVSSYYIEGMLWNVPNPSYGRSFVSTVANCLNHLRNARESDLMCANNLSPLVRDGRPDSLPTANFDTFITKAIEFWNAGG
jgi:hypothetical protein